MVLSRATGIQGPGRPGAASLMVALVLALHGRQNDRPNPCEATKPLAQARITEVLRPVTRNLTASAAAPRHSRACRFITAHWPGKPSRAPGGSGHLCRSRRDLPAGIYRGGGGLDRLATELPPPPTPATGAHRQLPKLAGSRVSGLLSLKGNSESINPFRFSNPSSEIYGVAMVFLCVP